MKALSISDAPSIILGLQDEIKRSDDSRYDHRLHAILLVAQGTSPRQVALQFGDAPRTVENWVRQFERDGLAGLVEHERSGRPRRLTERQLAKISTALRKPPSDAGFVVALWDGKLLAEYIHREFSIPLGHRQCQRMFRQLGFRQRKPRGIIGQADPVRREEVKKNSSH
jgi:transposase